MIWASGARKEALVLLGSIWATASAETRERIVETLLAGPPDNLLARLEGDERTSSKDRRIFDRLKVIERVGDPPLDPRLRAELDRIEAAYRSGSPLKASAPHSPAGRSSASGQRRIMALMISPSCPRTNLSPLYRTPRTIGRASWMPGSNSPTRSLKWRSPFSRNWPRAKMQAPVTSGSMVSGDCVKVRSGRAPIAYPGRARADSRCSD
jgi:hypothetical protein